MKLPKNSDYPDFAELHLENDWCPKGGCTPASLCEVSEALQISVKEAAPPQEPLERNHAARTKLEMKFWAAMHAAGIKDEWDAQERISISDLIELMQFTAAPLPAPAQQEPRCPTCGSTRRLTFYCRFRHEFKDGTSEHHDECETCTDPWHAAGKPEEPHCRVSWCVRGLHEAGVHSSIPLSKAKSTEQELWFHGTIEEHVATIERDWFCEGTWFAAHMEDAVKFGGPIVFSVKVRFPKERVYDWQVCCANAIPPAAIVWRSNVTVVNTKPEEPQSAKLGSSGEFPLESPTTKPGQRVVDWSQLSEPQSATEAAQEPAVGIQSAREHDERDEQIAIDVIKQHKVTPTSDPNVAVDLDSFLDMREELICERREAASLRERVADLEAAAKVLLDKLDVVLPKVDNAITLNTLRAGVQTYDGPQIGDDMKRLRELLETAPGRGQGQ
jgi:hypothetical protein